MAYLAKHNDLTKSHSTHLFSIVTNYNNSHTMTLYLIALLPVALLAFYMYKKDKYAPEPIGQLVKALQYGACAAIASTFISIPLTNIGLVSMQPDTPAQALITSFLGAAIPEELAKLFMLWLLLRKNKYYDEYTDGIVYAVFVSLGFAAIENIGYLLANEDDIITVGIIRALFSVPGHFGFGVLMGYYYALTTFSSHSRRKNLIFLFIAPILAHGIFDTLLFTMPTLPEWGAVIIAILFLIFCHTTWRYSMQRIKEHLSRDEQYMR